MRAYAIVIADAPSVFQIADPATGAQWSTQINGKHNPNAQQIEFQIEELSTGLVVGNSVLTIHGVSWDQIKQSANLVGKGIKVYGGMSQGLPLATFQARHYGLLLEGRILKCWANWIGTDTSLGIMFGPAAVKPDTGSSTSNSPSSSIPATSGPAPGTPGPGKPGETLSLTRTGFRSIDRRTFPRVQVIDGGLPVVVPRDIGGSILSDIGSWGAAVLNIGGTINSFLGGGQQNPLEAPLNLIHNLQKNVQLKSAVQETLSRVFPNAKLNILISSALKLGYQDAGIYQSLPQYVGYLNKLSQSILGPKNYLGIHVSSFSNTLNVWDGTTAISKSEIDYLDLIGHPTWIDPNTISVKVVLRANLNVGSQATIPQTLMNVTSDAIIPYTPTQKTNLPFSGTFTVTKVLHIGDYRNPDGANWCTNYEMVSVGATSGATPTENAVASSNQSPTVVTPSTGENPGFGIGGV